MQAEEGRIARTRELLQAIRGKHSPLARFIERLDMRGVNRVLRERGVLISELNKVYPQWDSEACWQQEQWQAARQEIEELRQTVLREAEVLMQAGRQKQEEIATELRQLKLGRQAQQQYQPAGQLLTHSRWGSLRG